MPSSNRQKILEEIDMATGDLTKAGQRLMSVMEKFTIYERHDWVQKWATIISAIDQIIDVFNDLRDQI